MNFVKAISIARTRSIGPSILDVRVGICFFGTPHRGAGSAGWAELGSSLSRAVRLGQGGGKAPGELRVFSNTVTSIHTDFVQVATGFPFISFTENRGCRGMGLVSDALLTNKGQADQNQIVEPMSATMEIPGEVVVQLDASHTDLCQFVSSDEDNWKRISMHVANMASDLTNESCKLTGCLWVAAPTNWV